MRISYKNYDDSSRAFRRTSTISPDTFRRMGDTASDRLRQARIARGYESASDAAKAYGWNPNTYISNENGNAPFSFKKASAYAEAYGVRSHWLYEGKGPMRELGQRTVPLVGYVGAGAHIFAEPGDPIGYVDAPDNATDNTVAAEIRGDSLGALFNSWLVYYDEVRRPVTADLIGRLCVVGLPDDSILVKKIRKARTPGFYHLDSATEETITDVEIVWAARVKSMTPR